MPSMHTAKVHFEHTTRNDIVAIDIYSFLCDNMHFLDIIQKEQTASVYT